MMVRGPHVQNRLFNTNGIHALPQKQLATVQVFPLVVQLYLVLPGAVLQFQPRKLGNTFWYESLLDNPSRQ